MGQNLDRRSYDTGASGEVREIIRLVRTTTERNDGTAQSAPARARAAVDNIG
jgi:hypothetical protein